MSSYHPFHVRNDRVEVAQTVVKAEETADVVQVIAIELRLPIISSNAGPQGRIRFCGSRKERSEVRRWPRLEGRG